MLLFLNGTVTENIQDFTFDSRLQNKQAKSWELKTKLLQYRSEREHDDAALLVINDLSIMNGVTHISLPKGNSKSGNGEQHHRYIFRFKMNTQNKEVRPSKKAYRQTTEKEARHMEYTAQSEFAQPWALPAALPTDIA